MKRIKITGRGCGRRNALSCEIGSPWPGAAPFILQHRKNKR